VSRRPIYPRLLCLRHVRLSTWQRALLSDGSLALAGLLVLADLASAWILLVLPLAVAAVVKAHDLLAGQLRPGPAAPPRVRRVRVPAALQRAGGRLRAGVGRPGRGRAGAGDLSGASERSHRTAPQRPQTGAWPDVDREDAPGPQRDRVPVGRLGPDRADVPGLRRVRVRADGPDADGRGTRRLRALPAPPSEAGARARQRVPAGRSDEEGAGETQRGRVERAVPGEDREGARLPQRGRAEPARPAARREDVQRIRVRPGPSDADRPGARPVQRDGAGDAGSDRLELIAVPTSAPGPGRRLDPGLQPPARPAASRPSSARDELTGRTPTGRAQYAPTPGTRKAPVPERGPAPSRKR